MMQQEVKQCTSLQQGTKQSESKVEVGSKFDARIYLHRQGTKAQSQLEAARSSSKLSRNTMVVVTY